MKRSLSYEGNNSLLYLVATPIGNLQEFSPRAISVIQNSDIIACEDTRNTAKLLSFFEIKKKFISLHEHNEISASNQIIELLKSGKKVSYVSDAGFPAISDPGAILIKKCLDNEINVSVISGSNALLVALVGSGLSTDHFYFHGFLKARKNEREKELLKLKNKEETLIFYESPHRIDDTLKSMLNTLGNREAVIARELTKMHEEYIRGKLEELATIDKETLRGEMVVIVEGLPLSKTEIDEMTIIDEYEKSDPKLSTRDRIDLVAEKLNVSKRKVYNLIMKNQR
jgi:16S rRNA (cytidine1402-2'-O)-methyltransferase